MKKIKRPRKLHVNGNNQVNVTRNDVSFPMNCLVLITDNINGNESWSFGSLLSELYFCIPLTVYLPLRLFGDGDVLVLMLQIKNKK